MSMPIETEKKYRLSELRRELVVFSLERSGAEFVGREFEENTIYSNDALKAEKAIVRIRKTDNKTLLTYKKRIQNESDVKEQIEHETGVSNPEAAEAIIAELGLKAILIYEKFRETWKLPTAEIVIDELPFGLFMEIEGSEDEIAKTESLLGIEDLETEHETYPRLAARLGEKKGSVTESRFTSI